MANQDVRSLYLVRYKHEIAVTGFCVSQNKILCSGMTLLDVHCRPVACDGYKRRGEEVYGVCTQIKIRDNNALQPVELSQHASDGSRSRYFAPWRRSEVSILRFSKGDLVIIGCRCMRGGRP